MKLTCVFLVLIGASFAMGTTTIGKTTAAMTTVAEKTTAVQTTAAPTTVNETTTAAPTTMNETTTMNATTAAPTTMNGTTAAPTTTPMMTTTPLPQETTWRLNNTNNSACILEQMEAVFSIMYEMVNAENKTVKSMIKFTLPQVATVDTNNSTCGSNDTMPMLTLVFGDPSMGNKFQQFFTMSANNSALTNITLALRHTDAIFPNSTQAGKLVMYSATLPSATFMVKNGQSYLCNAVQNFKINENANVTFSKVKVQTADIIDNKFGNVSQCPQDTPSTSPAPTSSTMSPTPSPLPPAHVWTVKTKDNKTCMIFNMSLEFNITYMNEKGKENFTVVALPANADDSQSECGSNTSAKFILTFMTDWMLEMDFTLDNKTKKYNNTLLKLTYSISNLVKENAAENNTVSTGQSGISASQGQYYSCMAEQKVQADNVTFIFSDVKIQPFAQKSNGTLGDAASCSADEKFNNIVPIAVGCALAGLVIIVLIAYLIGRQRSSKSGYESV